VKRHPALVALSQDHHHALVVAQKLRRATELTASEACRAFRDWWEPEGRRHFHAEEDILLPALAHHVDPADDAIVQTLVDHVAIRRDATLLGDRPPIGLLHAVGRRLADHVALEERQLFPLIEARLPEAELTALVAALAAAESRP
jgi:hypothetical protein